MLSLDKTKSTEDLQEWLGSQKGLLSWKMDGLTIVLTYENGSLIKAVTRGNGEIGEVITANARAFSNIPLSIAYKGQLVLRGEAVITYSDFEKINSQIGDAGAKYKNPRNLCSGSVRQLNSQITAERNVHFEAFALVRAEGVDFKNSRKCQFEWLKSQGFEVVHYEEVTAENLLRRSSGLGRRQSTMISLQTAWFFSMMILHTESHWDARRNFRTMPSHLSGRMRFGKPPFPISSGAPPERV